MGLYSLAISVHIVTAILGLGQVAGITVLASSTSFPAAPPEGVWIELGRLVRGTRYSLVVMLLSGALLDYASGGSFHDAWWFRISFGCLLVLGAISGRMGRALRKRDSGDAERALGQVARSSLAMCAIVAVVAILMEVKQPW